MSDVVCVGFITLDFIGHVEGFPGGTIAEHAKELDAACGGRAANQAMAITAIEGDVALIARVGTDQHAELLLEELVELGVETDFVTSAPSTTGLRLIAQRPDGRQAIVVHRGANDYLTVDDLNRRSDAFATARAVGVTTEPAGAVVLRALELAAQHQVPAVLTHQPSARPATDRVLSAADIVVMSTSSSHGLLDPDLAREQPKHSARALCQRGARAVALLSAEHVVFTRGEEAHLVPTPQSLDSEDAVDAFVGGLLNGLSLGDELPSAIMRGIRIAHLLVD